MNCKPGDLAINFFPGSPNLGRVVTVVEAYDGRPGPDGAAIETGGQPCWIVKGPGLVLWKFDGDHIPAEWTVMLDRWLRPIRDPGDDAQDETLSWLPVPSREGVEA